MIDHEFVPHPQGPDHYTGCTQYVEGCYCGHPRAAHAQPMSLYHRVLAHNAGRTHWDGCAAEHLVCALWQRVENATQSTEQMGAEILGLRDTVSKLVMEREARLRCSHQRPAHRRK